jgi:hypothetical protein
MYDLLLVIVFALNIFLPTFIGIRDRRNADRMGGKTKDLALLSNASPRQLRDTSSTVRAPRRDETAEAAD